MLFPWWQVSCSNDFQWNTLKADLVDFVYPDRYSFLSAVASSFHWKRFKLQSSVLHTFVKDDTRTSGAQAGNKSVFTP
ncbi:outer membrane vitamin B12 receptor protein, partial [gut metagenome]